MRTRRTRGCRSARRRWCDDGRVITGCNVENASYGLGLCAECTLVGQLRLTGGGRLVAVACRSGDGELLMPCGRCRQVLYEFGGPDCLVDTPHGPVPLREVLPRRVRPRRPATPQTEPVGRVRDVHAVDVIMTKRDGGRLSDEQIDWVLDAYTRGEVGDEQMAALAMAILLNGMDAAEISRWTQAMIDSGEVLALGDVGRPTVDKHSTGGVGDKITLPLAPLVAACGAAVPQLSGRGLGHTGGTLDKLESIPGWRAALSRGGDRGAAGRGGRGDLRDHPDPGAGRPQALRAARRHRHRRVHPADRQLDHEQEDRRGHRRAGAGREGRLRGVHEDAGAGPRAGRDHGRGSARTTGCRRSPLLTDMSVPLGRAVGNALEVAESVEVLRGGGPADVVELTVALAREMLALAGVSDVDPAEVLASGAAYPVWERMIAAQGGDPAAALPTAAHVEPVLADRSGVLTGCDALAVGVAAWRLGAGRARQADAVQAAAGVRLLVDPGDPVAAGQPLLELHTDTPDAVPGARAALDGELVVADEPTPRPALVLDTLRP